MKAALDNYVIRGVSNNISLLRDVIDERAFRDGDITTGYLNETYPGGFKGIKMDSDELKSLISIAGSLYSRRMDRAREFVGRAKSGVEVNSRIHRFIMEWTNPQTEEKVTFRTNVHFAETGKVSVTWTDGTQVHINGEFNLAAPVLELSVDGQPRVVQIANMRAGSITVIYKGTAFHLRVYPEVAAELRKHIREKPKLDLSSVITSPMPGVVKAINVQLNQVVTEGQELCVVEAMKMQNGLHALRPGTVQKISCQVGDTVEEGQILIEL